MLFVPDSMATNAVTPYWLLTQLVRQRMAYFIYTGNFALALSPDGELMIYCGRVSSLAMIGTISSSLSAWSRF